MPRTLTEEEARILEITQMHCGAQNTVELITWMRDDEATLWVTDEAGTMVLMVHLTNLASYRLDGTITFDEELRRDWLLIGDT